MSVQRWDFFGEVGINEPVRYVHAEAVEGRYVLHADHVAAVDQARAEGYDAAWEIGDKRVRAAQAEERAKLPENGADAAWYLLGQRRGRADAAAAVAALLDESEVQLWSDIVNAARGEAGE